MAGCMTGCLAGCDPKGPAAPILVSAITSDKFQQDLVASDPLQFHGDIMNKTADQALYLVGAAIEALPKVTLPLKCVHGAEDTIAYPAGSEMLHRLAGTPAADKSLDIIPDLRHEVLNEHEAARTAAIALFGDYLLGVMGVSTSVVNVGVKLEGHEMREAQTQEPEMERA
mmetsp:Transcript_13839/g.25767  ORF Transcript_13839/g.25767 Transcript_13839/m.25767 type:complete len:170 (-) Transcript_13839:247-756(-)